MTDGERWARAELAQLRRARFRPRAVEDFLAASLSRAGDARQARPDLVAQCRRWGVSGAVAWLALAAAGAQPFRRRLSTGLAGWAATIVMLDWHLGMVETPDGEAGKLGPADAATLARAWLAPAVADGGMPMLSALGFASDALDGRLARATRSTRLGRDLEGLADAAFTGAVLRGASRRRDLTPLAARIEVMRMAAGFGYAFGVYFGHSTSPDRRLLQAARLLAPLRASGAIAATAGLRRTGSALLLTGSGASVLALVAAARTLSGRAGATDRPCAVPPGAASAERDSAA